MKVGTDFSGIGSPEQALKNLGIKHDVIFACDVDKYAKQTYLANHSCQTFYDDITTRNHAEVPQLDLYIAGFPCQAFSLAGKRQGFDDVRGTLFFNVAEFIKTNQPKAFILENVKGLLSHDSGKTFQTITSILSDNGGTINGQTSIPFYNDGLGYHIYYQVLNTKDHGIPQNRERIFIVGFKELRGYRFPLPERLELKLKDLLEDDVDKKYWLSDEKSKGLLRYKKEIKKSIKQEISTTIDASYYKGFGVRSGNCRQIVNVGNVNPSGRGMNGNVYSENGISPTLSTNKGEGIKILSNTKKGYEVAQALYTNCNQGVLIGAIRGRNPENPTSRQTGIPTAQTLEINENGTSNCLISVQKDNVVVTDKIRRLTPLECFRLQGFPDSFIKVVSDTQLYKQAGNSITVNVIQKVIQNLDI